MKQYFTGNSGGFNDVNNQRGDKIDFYKFERFLNPLLSDSGFHSSLNYQIRPLNNYWAVKEYLKKLNALPEFVNQHFVNLREGLEKGVSQPRVIFKGYETTYNDHIVSDFKKSPFYKPFNSFAVITASYTENCFVLMTKRISRLSPTS